MMGPEEKARQKIDQLLIAAGWQVQDLRQLNLGAAPGVAVREFPLKSGLADYLLFINRKAAGIAVTVDMISTGTDIKPLECLLFMRDIKSRVYFEQMKGRGTRTISRTDFNAVTPDAPSKTHFIIVDAVGVCENDQTDSRPLERKRGVSLAKLMISVAMGNKEPDILVSLAGRLARLDQEINEQDKKKIKDAAEGIPLKQIINNLLDAVDPDKQQAKAREIFKAESLSDEQIKAAAEEMGKTACAPFDRPELRNTILEIKKRNEQIIDIISKDTVLFTGYDAQAKEKAQSIVNAFQKFITENKDEITALQIIYSRPYGKRHLTYAKIRQLAETIKKPPYHLNPDLLWQAYEKLEKSKVRGAGPQKMLTDIISLIRFAVGESSILEPFAETVNERFNRWLVEQERAGRRFTPEQVEWLTMIKDHIATSLDMATEDFELAPFYEKGGAVKAYQLFGPQLNNLLAELNEALAA